MGVGRGLRREIGVAGWRVVSFVSDFWFVFVFWI